MKKILSLLVVFGLLLGLVPAAALASAKTSGNAASRPSFRVEGAAFDDDYVPPAEGNARITFTAGDVWQDGSGYQMLLDADATAYGNEIPTTGPLTSSGDASEEVYAAFEYKIPENADGSLTTENIVVNNTITIEIPAGIYDWCITNPTPGDRVWITSNQGTAGGRADDYEFEEGYTYAFEVSLMGSNDGCNVTITDPTGYTPEPPTPVVGFYFEDEAEVAEFTIISNDSNSYTWDRYGSGAYEGNYCMRVHWQNTPHDWLITPAVEVPAVDPSVTFYAKAFSGTYTETVNVYVGTAPDPSAMTELDTNVDLPTVYQQFEYDLEDYAGQTIYFAIEYVADDAYYAYVDQIEFWGEDAEEPPAEQIIYEVDITDFTVPAWNEHPDFDVEVPEDAHCTVDYTAWTVVIDGNNEAMIRSDYFDSEEYSYFMSIRLVPDEGYEFEDLPEVTINGDSSLVNYAHTNVDGELLVYSSEFTVSAPIVSAPPVDEVIDTIEIINFVEPAWNEAPFYNVTVPDDANYSVDFIDWYWWDEANEEGNVMAPDQLFNNEAYVYYMDISVVPDEGYTFDEGTVLLLNGSASNVDYGYFDDEEGAYWAYTVDFTVEDPGTEPPVAEPIDTIEINDLTLPEWGENPDYDVTVPADAHYSVDYMDWNWWDINADEGEILAPSQAFDNENYVYYAYWQIIPDEGYEFADEVTVLVDGDASVIETKGWSANSGYYWAYTIDFTVEDPGTEPPETEPPEMSDLDRALNIEGGTIHFETGETYPWIVVEDIEDGREYAKSSNAGVSSSTSTLTTTVTAAAGSLLVFDYNANGEGTGGEVGISSVWDACSFSVDGTVVLKVGSAQAGAWNTFTYTFEEGGEHTLTWSYSKDSSVNPTGDYFAVDNVYVGEPVLPEAINVFDVTVKANRNTYVVYTMEPDGVTATEVTFEIADTSIATVDENGMIHGVAVGETTVTVTSVADPTVSGTATVTVTEPDPEVDLYGYATYDIGSTYTGDWITFTDREPGTVSELCEADDAYAAAYYDGFVYGYRQEDGAFFKMNAETYEVEYPEDGAALEGVTALDMAYNYANQTMYLLAQDNDTYNILLFTVDLETGAASECGQLSIPSGGILALTYDGEGNLYGLGYSSTSAGFYGIDVETLECTLIGETGVPMNYVQSMHYDMNTGRLFWAQIFSTSSNGLYEIDPETGAAELLGTIGESGMEITGLYTIYDEGGEPEPIDLIEVEGFTVPAWGEHPDYDVSVPDGAHYSIIYTDWNWYDDSDDGILGEDEFFDSEDRTYYQYFAIVPDEGYCFSEDVTATINGGTEYVDTFFSELDSEDGYYYMFSIDFTVEEPSEPEPIDLIEINDFVVPEWGANPFYGVTVPEDAHYSKIQGLWYRYNASGPMNPDDTFNDPDEQYYMYFFFVPMEGYEFADDVTVLINGSAALVFFSTAENGGISVYTNYFTVEEDDPYAIHEVWVDGWGTPVEGVAGIDHVFLTTPEDAPYYIIYAGWLDEDEGQQLWNDEHVFIAGHYYSEGCQIWAEDGYYFAEDCVFLTHDGDDILDVGWCYVDEEENWICFMNSIPTMCEGSAPALLGDVDLDGEVTTADALLAMRAAMGLIELTDEQLAQMDVNGDGVYDLVDATLILRYAMGIIDEFPIPLD